MIKKYSLLIITAFIIFFSSCLGQRKSAVIPEPVTEFFDFTLPVRMENIIESRDGTDAGNLPFWLQAYINGGIDEVERIAMFYDRYLFIGMSEGKNFNAMRRWAEFFSPMRDTAMLAARRIEKKLLTSASLYPDNEYGPFFETIIKEAYSISFPQAVKEDTYWVKIRIDETQSRTHNYNIGDEIYVFFVLISIDRNELQHIIDNMITRSIASSVFTGNQRYSVNRLQQNFFEGF